MMGLVKGVVEVGVGMEPEIESVPRHVWFLLWGSNFCSGGWDRSGRYWAEMPPDGTKLSTMCGESLVFRQYIVPWESPEMCPGCRARLHEISARLRR